MQLRMSAELWAEGLKAQMVSGDCGVRENARSKSVLCVQVINIFFFDQERKFVYNRKRLFELRTGKDLTCIHFTVASQPCMDAFSSPLELRQLLPHVLKLFLPLVCPSAFSCEFSLSFHSKSHHASRDTYVVTVARVQLACCHSFLLLCVLI